jgi:hypothetical protein
MAKPGPSASPAFTESATQECVCEHDGLFSYASAICLRGNGPTLDGSAGIGP